MGTSGFHATADNPAYQQLMKINQIKNVMTNIEPKEALLRYAEQAEENPEFTQIYNIHQNINNNNNNYDYNNDNNNDNNNNSNNNNSNQK